MTTDDFKPRLGRIRDSGRAKAIRHSTRVIGEAARNVARPLRRNGHIDPNAHRRGLAHGAISASGLFTPGSRRVIVKARYSRLAGGNIGPAQAHLRYVLRDGTTAERTPGSYAIFDRGTRRHALTGKVIGVGMIDEITDRTWTVVDGVDGRVNYVELGRLTPDKAPRRGDVVRISADRLEGKPQAAPRLAVLSRTPADSLPSYDGPTWLDRLVVTGDATMQSHSGFGAHATRDIEARRQWLIAQDLGRATADGRFELRASAPAQLRQRELQRIAADISRAVNVDVQISRPGERVSGVYERAIDTPTGRLAVLRRQDSISIAPWTSALEPMRGRAVTGLVQPGKVAWSLDRGRALPGHVR